MKPVSSIYLRQATVFSNAGNQFSIHPNTKKFFSLFYRAEQASTGNIFYESEIQEILKKELPLGNVIHCEGFSQMKVESKISCLMQKILDNPESNICLHLDKLCYEYSSSNYNVISLLVRNAALKGNIAILKSVLHPKYAIKNSKDLTCIALLSAVQGGNLDTIKFLLAEGGSFQAKDCSERNLLILAASYGHLDIVKFLVKSGQIRLDAKDKNKKSAIRYAYSSGHIDVAQFLIQHVIKMGGCFKGPVPFLHALGIPISCKKHRKKAILNYMVRENWGDILEIFFKYRWDLDLDFEIDTSLTLALSSYLIKKGRYSCFDILVKNGACISHSAQAKQFAECLQNKSIVIEPHILQKILYSIVTICEVITDRLQKEIAQLKWKNPSQYELARSLFILVDILRSNMSEGVKLHCFFLEKKIKAMLSADLFEISSEAFEDMLQEQTLFKTSNFQRNLALSGFSDVFFVFNS